MVSIQVLLYSTTRQQLISELQGEVQPGAHKQKKQTIPKTTLLCIH